MIGRRNEGEQRDWIIKMKSNKETKDSIEAESRIEFTID